MRERSLTIRKAEPEDAPAAVELLNRVPLALYGEPEFTEDQMLVWWRDPNTEQWLVEDDAGALVGEFGLGVHDGGRKIFLGAAGEPDVLQRLFALGETRACELGESRPVIRTRVEAEDPNRASWEAAGYTVVRHWFQMSIDLDAELQEPSWPVEVGPRAFVRGADDRVVYDADMEAFADHWDFSPIDYERWRLWTVERPGFDPSLWVLAEDAGAVAGFALNDPHRSGVPGVARVGALGVLRPWRRRGVGLALLLESFRVLRDAGFAEARLEVDAENPTGAVRLYERAGMRVIRSHVTYEKALGAA